MRQGRLQVLVITDQEGGIWMAQLAPDWMMKALCRAAINCSFTPGDIGAERVFDPDDIPEYFAHLDYAQGQFSQCSIMPPAFFLRGESTEVKNNNFIPRHNAGFRGPLSEWIRLGAMK